jgi:uncharacterized iron-regulated membrane protein
MANRLRASLPASMLGLAVCFGLAVATLTGSLAGLAHADDNDNRNRQWNGSRQEHAHQQVQQQEHRREPQHYQGYYRQPNVYYSAPPVVYQPPGASIYLGFPYFYN